MEYEYEGKTEREAIEKAASDLDLERDQFDVEVLESQKGTLFKKGFVRIRVITAATPNAEGGERGAAGESSRYSPAGVASIQFLSKVPRYTPATEGERGHSATLTSEGGKCLDTLRYSATPTTATLTGSFGGGSDGGGDGSHGDGDVGTAAGETGTHAMLADPRLQPGFESDAAGFVAGMIEKMGYTATICAQFREPQKVGFRIDSPDCAVIIGRKGSTLDALQLLANVYAGKIGHEDMRIILDCQNYRLHREEQLVRLAYNTADKVAATKRSILLEAMNPFERRIIHTTLGDVPNITTKSEGNGVYKRVRIMWRGMR